MQFSLYPFSSSYCILAKLPPVCLSVFNQEFKAKQFAAVSTSWSELSWGLIGWDIKKILWRCARWMSMISEWAIFHGGQLQLKLSAGRTTYSFPIVWSQENIVYLIYCEHKKASRVTISWLYTSRVNYLMPASWWCLRHLKICVMPWLEHQ